jgi:hypothetical protein
VVFAIAEEFATILGVVVGVATAAAGAFASFRGSRRLYETELGGVKVTLREASEAAGPLRVADETSIEREVEEAISRLREPTQPPTSSTETAQEVAALLRDELTRVRQAADQRSERILSDEYHTEGLAQSKLAFIFSLVFASLGFLIIVASVVVVLVDDSVEPGIVTLVSGTVVEAVSALFFVQANRSRRLMVEFFDKLRVDRSLEESLKLSGDIPNELIKSRLRTLLAVRLAQADATDDVLRILMAAEQLEPTPQADRG